MNMFDTPTNTTVKYTTLLLSDKQKNMFSLINYVILCGVISVFGSVANVINMIVFYRQGLDTTVNISFFSLAISDLCSLILQQWFNLYVNPLFVDLNLPIVYTDLQYFIPGMTREMFARVTCLITAFITTERYICVAFPLHVKRIITLRVTVVIITVIFASSLLSPMPLYVTSYYVWTFYPDSNQTILGLAFTSHNSISNAFVYFSHAFFTMLGFMSVITFTLILTYKLKQKSEWRQTTTTSIETEKTKSMSKRERATVFLVVLVAGILVACYTPAVLLGLTVFLVPEFSLTGKHYNLFYSVWTFGLLFENINSSVNIFLYYKMSSKYRETFINLFSKCAMNDTQAKRSRG